MKKETCPWKSRELGCDERYVAVASAGEAEAIDKALGLSEVSFRISNDLKEKLKAQAKTEGLNINAFMRAALEKALK